MIVETPSSDAGNAGACLTELIEIGETSSEGSGSTKSEVRCVGTDHHDDTLSSIKDGRACAMNSEQELNDKTPRKERNEQSQSSISERQSESSTSPIVPSHQVLESRIPHISPTKPGLKSALKKNSQVNRSKNNGSSRRRVRGLWGETPSNEFSKFREAILKQILSYLSMDDICNLSATSRRWWTLVNHPSCWKNVDATDFVIRTYRTVSNFVEDPASRTGAALKHRLRNRTPDKLTIRSIHNRLDPDTYLPSTASLRELTLSEFTNLTDTHVHVMLLSSAVVASQVRMKSSIAIRKLCLENCPLLTNGALRSIASQCTLLEELSISGCQRVSDVKELGILFRAAEIEAPGSLSQQSFATDSALDYSAGQSLESDRASRAQLSTLFGPETSQQRLPKEDRRSNLSALFAPPPATTVDTTQSEAQSSHGLSFAPPPTTRQTPTETPTESSSSGLSSLFESTQPTTFAISQNSHNSTSSSDDSPLFSLSRMFAPQPKPNETKSVEYQMPNGDLSSLFATSATSTPSANNNNKLMSASAKGNLTSLDLSGTSVTAGAFHEALWKVEGKAEFESLKMNGSGESWQESFFEELSLKSCKVLDVGCADCRTGSKSLAAFGGQQSASCTEIEYLDLSGHKRFRARALADFLLSARKLCALKLEGCVGIFSDKLEHFTMFLSAMKGSPCLSYISISRCFSDEHQAEFAGDVLNEDEERGKRVLDAICTGLSRHTIQELDMSWCWFATASEVAQIRRQCPRLRRLHLVGTRCNAIH